MNTPNDKQQDLKDQYDELNVLASSLAHEIKNPLSTIRMNVELLGEDLEEVQLPAREEGWIESKRSNGNVSDWKPC